MSGTQRRKLAFIRLTISFLLIVPFSLANATPRFEMKMTPSVVSQVKKPVLNTSPKLTIQRISDWKAQAVNPSNQAPDSTGITKMDIAPNWLLPLGITIGAGAAIYLIFSMRGR
jgi:hypothetical protein